MANKERGQNPAIGDNLTLRFFSYNANLPTNVTIQKVDIYFMDDTLVSESNPHGLRLVETVTDISHNGTGQYSATINLVEAKFNIGRYVDEWTIQTEENLPLGITKNEFKIYPNLWFTSPWPIIYDFDFSFRPNKIRSGSKRYLEINIVPNVPTATDLERYYAGLVISADIKISIEMECVECMPDEQDLRVIVDRQPVTVRSKLQNFYFLDTTDIPCGIYNVWFEMGLGENFYITDKQQLQIY